MNLSEQPTRDVGRCCRLERPTYGSAWGNLSPSPCCTELFRRSFNNNADAWQEVYEIFLPLVRRWCGVQSRVEVEDVAQDVWMEFSRTAPRDLPPLAADDLARILAYLKRRTKWQLLMADREQKKEPPAISIEDVHSLMERSSVTDDQRLVLERLFELLPDPRERNVCILRFAYRIAPREIATRYPEYFANVTEVYHLVRSSSNKLWNDPILRDIHSSDTQQSSDQPTDHGENQPGQILEFRVDADSKGIPSMEPPCDLDEAIIFDYLADLAPANVRAQVEARPACIAAAQRLASALAALESSLYRVLCPSVDKLIAYQEQSLESNHLLAIRRHVLACPHCREEIKTLQDIDQIPLNEPSLLTPLRQLFEAILRPPLASQRRGGLRIHEYTAPRLTITVSLRKAAGQARRWRVQGDLRDQQGIPLSGILEQVRAKRPGQSDVTAEVSGSGAFILPNLPAGTYDIYLLTADMEVVIRALQIGDED